MTEGVTQETAAPEKTVNQDKEVNFRRLETAWEREKEARYQAEMKSQLLQKEIEMIKASLAPVERDPLDEIEDFSDPVQVKEKINKKLNGMLSSFERKAKEIVEKTVDEKNKVNWDKRLKKDYPDYMDVVTPEACTKLEQSDPLFLQTALKLQDEYDRGEAVYQYLKRQKKAPQPSIQEKVENNKKNNYLIPDSHGIPTAAIEFDVSTRKSRDEAYAKLKAAQRGPIGKHGQAYIARR